MQRCRGSFHLLFSLSALMLLATVAKQATAQIMTGADVSELAREEQLGTMFKDANGNSIDAMQQFQNEHWNCCRLRLWVNPSGKDIFVNNLSYTIALARRLKSHGMK